MRVLAVRHHGVDSAGFIGAAFEARGAQLTVHLLPDEGPLPAPDVFDHVVLLGAESSVNDPHPWIAGELAWLRTADAAGVPVLGICFGAQALCLYHGGVVERSNEPEIGWYDVEARNGSGISSGPWFEFHFDHCRLPEEAELWATSPRAVQAFCVGRNVGVQFHPEVDHLQLQDWFANGVDEARDFGVDADALVEQTRLETPAARERALDLVDLFLTHTKR